MFQLRSKSASLSLTRASSLGFVLALGFILLGIALGYTPLQYLNWINLALHASLEMAGAAFALLTAYFLLRFDSQELSASAYRSVIACGLIVMGLLDGAHAMSSPGASFVWLHTAATLFSGIAFALVLLPVRLQTRLARPLWAAALSLGLILISLIKPDWMPVMLIQGKFSHTFVLLNVLGGSFMLFAAYRLIRSFQKTAIPTELLFGLQTSLFGASSLFLSDSSLWNYFWWQSHFFRLLAHAVALLLLVSIAQRVRQQVLQRLQQSALENQLIAANAEIQVAKRTAALTQNYQNLVLALPLGLLVLELPNLADSHSLRISDLNPAAELQLKISATILRGKVFVEAFPGLLESDLPQRYAQVIRLQLADDIGRIVYGDQRLAEAVYSIKAFPLHGQKVGIVFEDVSAEYKAQRIKEEFVSIVSHELRTPLTSIRGAIGLVLGGVLGDVAAQARPILEIAQQNCERLTILINDLLDMEKIQSGKMEFEFANFAIDTIVEQALLANRQYAEQFSINLRFENTLDVAYVNVDKNRLIQVIANLLSNAVKFSPSGAEVQVRLSRVGAEVLLEVIDHGNGIPDNFKEMIFEKFSQAEAPGVRKKGGAGLGLSIAKSMIEKMGGSIGYASKEGLGACFFIRLPEVAQSVSATPPI
ncbi:ATP-binding protein [Undibacterium parvum]|uniref:histidine kinase n=1 Tax=Undibacterium piscinae TaxID=2495591 RepID=A0A6M4A3E4_9BURK|nr:ATP-binding protein [Undibacterium parvum]QJQ05791.1 hypothetical protein EJG51_007950 [Undibacterium piscinae]